MADLDRRTLLLSAAGGALTLLNVASSQVTPMDTDNDLPIVRAALGDSLLDVQRASRYRFQFDRIDDYDLVGRDELVQFVFAGPRPFDLPPTRFFALECTAALVVAIDTSPHREFLSQQQALTLADGLLERIMQAGWTNVPNDHRVTGREELLLRLRDPATSEDMRWYISSHTSDTATLMLRLRRAHRAGRMADHDLFLLNLQFRDEALMKRADKAGDALRLADGFPADGARRITLESYVPRVRQLIPR